MSRHLKDCRVSYIRNCINFQGSMMILDPSITVSHLSLVIQTPLLTLRLLCMTGSCQSERRASHFPQMLHQRQLAPAISRSRSLCCTAFQGQNQCCPYLMSCWDIPIFCYKRKVFGWDFERFATRSCCKCIAVKYYNPKTRRSNCRSNQVIE